MVRSVVCRVARERARLGHAAELPERERIGGGGGRQHRLGTGGVREGVAIAVRIGHVLERVVVAARSVAPSSERAAARGIAGLRHAVGVGA